MKIKIERTGKEPKSYYDGDKLQPNTFYEDAQNGVYWTDDEGYIEAGVWDEMYVDVDSIGWPLRDSNVKSITISK